MYFIFRGHITTKKEKRGKKSAVDAFFLDIIESCYRQACGDLKLNHFELCRIDRMNNRLKMRLNSASKLIDCGDVDWLFDRISCNKQNRNIIHFLPKIAVRLASLSPDLTISEKEEGATKNYCPITRKKKKSLLHIERSTPRWKYWNYRFRSNDRASVSR